MMLHLGKQNNIARAQIALGPGLRDQVNGVGGAGSEYEFGRVGGTNESGKAGASVFEGVSRAHG